MQRALEQRCNSRESSQAINFCTRAQWCFCYVMVKRRLVKLEGQQWFLLFPLKNCFGSIFLKSCDTCYALYGCGCHSASAFNKSSIQFMRGRFVEERQNTFITSNKSVLCLYKTSNLQAASVWQIWLANWM